MNEYYEPLAGIDARCNVHDENGADDDDDDEGKLCFSQAFSLIDCKVLDYNSQEYDQKNQGNDTMSLLPQNDPLRALSSLKDIVDNNLDSKFFVVAFFHEDLQSVIVLLFVRNLPKGFDVEFDNKLESLFIGNEDVLDDVELSIQLGKLFLLD